MITYEASQKGLKAILKKVGFIFYFAQREASQKGLKDEKIYNISIKKLYKKHPKRDWKIFIWVWFSIWAHMKHPKRDWKFNTAAICWLTPLRSIPKGIESTVRLRLTKSRLKRKHPKRDWKFPLSRLLFLPNSQEASQKGLKARGVIVQWSLSMAEASQKGLKEFL